LGVAVLCGSRALEWAWQKVFWQIDRNLQDYLNYEKILKIVQQRGRGSFVRF